MIAGELQQSMMYCTQPFKLEVRRCSQGSLSVAGLHVVVLIPRQLCCGFWLADCPIADCHGPIAGHHTTWWGKLRDGHDGLYPTFLRWKLIDALEMMYISQPLKV